MNCPSILGMEMLITVALYSAVAHCIVLYHWMLSELNVVLVLSSHFIGEKTVGRSSLGSNWHCVLLFWTTINKISQMKNIWNHHLLDDLIQSEWNLQVFPFIVHTQSYILKRNPSFWTRSITVWSPPTLTIRIIRQQSRPAGKTAQPAKGTCS